MRRIPLPSNTYKKLGQIPVEQLMALLEKNAPELFEAVKAAQNSWDSEWDGVKRTRLPQSLAKRIDDWLVAQEPPRPPYKDPFNDEMAALVTRESQRLKDAREATARLEEWRSQGLVDNQHNANAIMNFITTHPVLRGKFTAQSVDIAVDFLGRKGSNILQWQQNAVAAPPPPAKPTVERLPNGEPRLPLGTTPSRQHSVAQLRDLDQRQRKR